jgi:hypothetical protein
MPLPDPSDTSKQPRSLRWFLQIGKHFGWHWLPEDFVQAYYYKSRYAGVKEPNEWGLFRMGRFETLGPAIYTGAYFEEYQFDGIVTRDQLNVRVRLRASFRYDPRENPDVARALIRIPQERYPAIAETYFRCATLVTANRYTAAQLNQAEYREQIEDELRQRADAEMSFLGMHPLGKPRLLRVELPPRLVERWEVDAQRSELINAIRALDPTEFRRAVVTELLENLKQHGVGDSLLGFRDVLEAYVSAAPATWTPTIDHTSAGSAAPRAPSAPPSSGPPRPRSRL